MRTLNAKQIAKLSTKFESGKSLTSMLVKSWAVSHKETYCDYAANGKTIFNFEVLHEFEVLVTDNHETVANTIEAIREASVSNKHFKDLLRVYLMGLHYRGIGVVLKAGGESLTTDGQPVDGATSAYKTTESIVDLTKVYNIYHLNTRVYEVLAMSQGALSEVRLGDTDATYIARKILMEQFPERTTDMWIAGKEVTMMSVPDLGLPKVDMTKQAKTHKSKVSSTVRELLDDSFDYEFLDLLTEQAKKFSYNGQQLDGYYYYDYRGRIYWTGNINPQANSDARDLEYNGIKTAEYDATCSGIQIGSIISGNRDMMLKTNVLLDETGSKRKKDAYQYIADMSCKILGVDEGTIDRAIAKKPVMLLPYGASARTLLNHAYDEARDRGHENWKEIGKAVYEAVKVGIDRHSTYKRILELIEIKHLEVNGASYGTYCEWQTPDGLNVRSYSKIPVRKIYEMESEGHNILHPMLTARVSIETDAFKYANMVRYNDGTNIKSYKDDTPSVGAIVPNFVHSMDAFALRTAAKNLIKDGYPLFVVHDCFIVPETVGQEKLSGYLRDAYQQIADYVGTDINVNGMIVYGEYTDTHMAKLAKSVNDINEALGLEEYDRDALLDVAERMCMQDLYEYLNYGSDVDFGKLIKVAKQ